MVMEMLADGMVELNTKKFTNDMTTFGSCDDVLTLLVHLGYLSYDFSNKTVRIPNSEVKMEYVNSIEDLHWDEVVRAVHESKCLLKSHADKPACEIELKCDNDANGAIAQIKERNYTASLADYQGNILLAGINYGRETKTHTCVIAEDTYVQRLRVRTSAA